jgi:hypothetical protein
MPNVPRHGALTLQGHGGGSLAAFLKPVFAD